MHPRNPHQDRYNFTQLIQATPALKKFVQLNKYGDESINFDDPAAVRSLNQALLAHFYRIKYWELPEEFLCPPIPGRADYIHHLADLVGTSAQKRGLDIGVGANCIYPLIGHQAYGWSFVGSEVNPDAIMAARSILSANQLEKRIELRLQSSKQRIFDGMIVPGEHFDFTMCNPPFHASAEDALKGTERKRRNLKLKGPVRLNFGGKADELWCKGGEKVFIEQMIIESARYPKLASWFTTLVSKEENLALLEKLLKRHGCAEFKIIPMSQGQKKSRILAWKY